ncbi:nucleoside-diphosphate-sugar epimerase [Methylohalomonas lacus]|uniref:Nucleoside-diphosphate-sugar epimerase n=1 Tax=Methylohalomonas lacus TaxID=398773 RepID=A0AAE3HJL3_9GAMM|nr:GDP-mannose 4,6-dehydratase [Methylohalomonas lacus]MCS3903561.1 nucleoside-diphosphate-sugar epimerase [Methylohalomonas lacus]
MTLEGEGTVLLTGARGFTGQYLRANLEHIGWYVHGVVHGETPGSDESACDLTDAAAVSTLVGQLRPTHVVHLAGLAFVGESDVEAFYRVNVLATTNLLAALGQHADNVRKVVIASSANVYGRPSVECVDESLCPAPVNHYGCSKLAMEHMARTWFERLPIILTRPFNYTGVGQAAHFLIPKIVDHLRRGASAIELGNTAVSRDFTDVRDVVQTYTHLLASDACSQTVNISSGRSVSLDWIIQYMQELAGYEITIHRNPALMRSSEIPRLQGDNTRLKQLTGFVPGIPMEETLKWMYAGA